MSPDQSVPKPKYLRAYQTKIVNCLIQFSPSLQSFTMNWRSNPQKRIILDNGSSKIRLGNAGSSTPQLCWHNLIAIDKKTGHKLMGDDIIRIWDETKVVYEKPNVRGVTVKFDQEMNLWEEMFNNLDYLKQEQRNFGMDLSDFSMTFALLPHRPRQILERYLQIFFDHFKFDVVLPVQSSRLIYQKAKKDYGPKTMAPQFQVSHKFAIVVQSSDSATHITPIMNGEILSQGVRKINVGGRLLSNWLKEMLSFRHLDLKNSDLLIRQIKEEMCYVSQSFDADMKGKMNTLSKHFVLPDQELGQRGHSVDEWDPNSFAQKLTLNKERIQIPEILFRPQDIGLQECGISQGILQSLQVVDEDIRHNFLQNIIVTGGNTSFQGFSQRLYKQLNQNSATWVKPRIYAMSNKDQAFQAAVQYSKKSHLSNEMLTSEYYKQVGFQGLKLF